jgi:TRAP transporter TAXI family solute receptor
MCSARACYPSSQQRRPSTPRSVYNVGHVQSGELEFAIVQSDVQYEAHRGLGAWSGRPVSDLRSVLSLYPELATLIAAAGTNIHDIADLVGKRINVGSKGTGTRATWDAIAAEFGQSEAKQMHLRELRADDSTSALCNGTIDANFFMVGYPSAVVSRQLSACPANFVPITGPVIARLVHSHPFYVRGAIPAGMYGASADIPTFGSRATLVTSESVDAHIVAAIAKAMLVHLAELRAAHPALAGLRAEEMAQGLTAPLHPASQI